MELVQQQMAFVRVELEKPGLIACSAKITRLQYLLQIGQKKGYGSHQKNLPDAQPLSTCHVGQWLDTTDQSITLRASADQALFVLTEGSFPVTSLYYKDINQFKIAELGLRRYKGAPVTTAVALYTHQNSVKSAQT